MALLLFIAGIYILGEGYVLVGIFLIIAAFNYNDD